MSAPEGRMHPDAARGVTKRGRVLALRWSPRHGRGPQVFVEAAGTQDI
ncbi:hypothetical protein [Thiohalorhabdus denitrificans]|uniref:Uncharacterized protein n=1 Tax=Thiohalorhabdus denitrificans TaxID=381306 RepID=A0A1G5C274_9GAMM|nr:hypothetical protein [Thiohalorhabdus denitrificans]SCX96569.1 hypothetical protein SAMN05661077_0862 [Thiohalorhabdus denitrificans]